MGKIDVDLNVSGAVLRSCMPEVIMAVELGKQYRFRLEEIAAPSTEDFTSDVGAHNLKCFMSRIVEPKNKNDIGCAEVCGLEG